MGAITAILREFRTTPMLWFLLLVPVLFVYHSARPEDATTVFLLSVGAIIPLAVTLTRATESVAAKTGDLVGGLLNATLGNLTELIISLAALRAGQIVLVKASIAGAIFTNTLFMLGASFLLGGLKNHTQRFNKENARLQSSLLFLASVALVVPSIIATRGVDGSAAITGSLSIAIGVILMVTYALGLLFSLKTHKTDFAGEAGGHDEPVWPMRAALPVLAGVTVLIAMVSEVFIESVQEASVELGLSAAFVGFIVVALVGAAAEMTAAFAAARKDRLDLSVGIALGSASQIALFVAPLTLFLSYAIAPVPMDLVFWPGAVLMVLVATATTTMVTGGGKSAWFVGAILLAVYLVFASTLYLLPPRTG